MGVGLGHQAICSSLASISTALEWTVGSVTNHKLSGTHLELTHRRAHQSQASQELEQSISHTMLPAVWRQQWTWSKVLVGPGNRALKVMALKPSRPDGEGDKAGKEG